MNHINFQKKTLFVERNGVLISFKIDILVHIIVEYTHSTLLSYINEGKLKIHIIKSHIVL